MSSPDDARRRERKEERAHAGEEGKDRGIDEGGARARDAGEEPGSDYERSGQGRRERRDDSDD